jgi:uncharacterized membrane protein
VKKLTLISTVLGLTVSAAAHTGHQSHEDQAWSFIPQLDLALAATLAMTFTGLVALGLSYRKYVEES